MVKFKIRIIIVTALLCVFASLVQAQDIKSADEVYIQPQEKWQTIFGGREAVYHFQITAVESIEGRLGWSLRYENRTIARGESLFKAGPDRPSLIEIRLNIPLVKEGVMMPIQFTVNCYSQTDEHILASWEQTLCIFHEDAFALKKEWLKNLFSYLSTHTGAIV